MKQTLSWVDTHCHLIGKDSTIPLSEMLLNIEENLSFAVAIATDKTDNQGVYELSRDYPFLYGAVGVHPLHVEDYNESMRGSLINWAKDAQGKIVAIGEIGLDYFYDDSNADIQKKVFTEQLQVAKELDMPVVIHARNSILECLAIVKDFPSLKKVVFHCFTGNTSEAKAILEAGYWISFTGIITFPKSIELREIISFVPEDRIMIETDSPFLAPVPYRGKVNQPLYVGFVGEKVAEIKGWDIEEAKKILWDNSKKFFNISL